MILKETILSAFNERGTLLKWLKTVERLITERVLVKPVNNPQSTEIVAVNSTGEQAMLEVGTGLTIENGVLKLADVYDGTVIIEKAESVLGLRRFKETYTTVGAFDYSESFIETFYNENHFVVSPIDMEDIIYGMSPIIILRNYTELGDLEVICLDYYEKATDSRSIIALPLIEFGSNLSVFGNFEVLSTTNSTVDEWILANTEGVGE